MNTRFITVACVAAFAFSAATAMPAFGGFKEAAKETKPTFGVRYRFETVEQTGIDGRAGASTARVRFGWVMAASEGFSAGMQADYVSKLGPEEYNSTDNGRTEFPVVADPTGFDLNQAFLRYRKGPVTVTAGRQRIAHAGQQFVGFKAWRQNEQSFDALRVEAADSHLLRASWTPAEGHSLGAFNYLLDFEKDNGPANSNATFGVDYTAAVGSLGLAASVGRQRDWGEQPVQYDAPYYAVETRWTPAGAKFALGWEVFGSDGGVATVQTPLGAEHICRGSAGKFAAVKPAMGLEDLYVSASGKVGPMTFAATVHTYHSRRGDLDQGTEAGVSAAYARESLSLHPRRGGTGLVV
ncbi:MAG: alginate export family protein [Gammaproteobacteria bacterium]|nr:alginate export family protein [Gammaproteobacteria bacterium]